jgi:hypothetical protein
VKSECCEIGFGDDGECEGNVKRDDCEDEKEELREEKKSGISSA